VETSEKTFRYTYVFKNLGVLYLIFLILIIIISLIGRETVFFICDGVMVFGGLIFVAIYLNTRVVVSETEITTKTILHTRSLMWSEIDSLSSRGTSLKLHGRDDGLSLTINPRMNGAADILDLILSKRPDLFTKIDNEHLLRPDVIGLIGMALGISMFVLAFYLYLRDIALENLTCFFVVGLMFLLQGFFNWLSNVRNITLDEDQLTFHYPRKTVSIPVEDIESVQVIRTQWGQLKSVFLVLTNRGTVNIAGPRQSPFILYPVLKEWHERNTINNIARQLNRN